MHKETVFLEILTENRLDYQPLFRESEPALMPEKTAGLVN